MDTSSQKHFVIIAGEASGDMHAAYLVYEIKKINPNITFSGLGGPQMKKSGVLLYEDLTKLAVVGFLEVIKHIKEIKRLFRLILKKVKESKVDAVILVDYPGFNLRLARELKKMGIKVIYYISPQVWAWKENRVKLIKKCTDKMLVLFQFEKKFYARHEIDVTFVGHPLIDTVNMTNSKETFLSSIGLLQDKTTIGILPGSRQKEIEHLLPIMLDAAQFIYKKNQNMQFLILKAPTLSNDTLNKYFKGINIPIKLVETERYDALNACDVCMVASGTATLETAILQKPMVVIYKTSFLTWILAKLFVKIPYIGLVNVVAGKKIVPECLQFDATPKKIAQEIRDIIDNPTRFELIKSELSKVKSSLGESGASQRTAQAVLKTVC